MNLLTLVLILMAALLGLWAVVILTRAALYRPLATEAVAPALPEVVVDGEQAARRLSEMIRCRTVKPGEGEGYEQFDRFRRLLRDFYPLAHDALEGETVKEHNLLYRWPGRGGERPLVLMAHYDVVPASGEQWSHPPFDGVIEAGVIWGRGALDTKNTLCGIFEAVEALLGAGYRPEQDIYLAFGHDEETMGRGALAIVEELRARGVRPEMVLDEGGAVLSGMFPGVKRPIAVVGTAEKGFVNIEVVLQGGGGHSSAPDQHNPLAVLSRIILNVEKNPFEAHLPGELLELFTAVGRHMPFALRVIFANLWCFKPLLKVLVPRLGREMNALCRTTAVFTMAEGSSASNVVPDRVRAVVNLRNAARDPLDKALAHIRSRAAAASEKARRAADPLRLEVNLLNGHDASPSSSTASAAYALLVRTVKTVFPQAVVTPYIMLGATDARHFHAISDNVLRFSPMALSKEELRSIHGVDEKITVEQLSGVVTFYLNLIGAYQELENGREREHQHELEREQEAVR